MYVNHVRYSYLSENLSQLAQSKVKIILIYGYQSGADYRSFVILHKRNKFYQTDVHSQ